ncbi:MAG: hypothetical protein WBL84_02290, partial [Xanthobacteraceae bacterium]
MLPGGRALWFYPTIGAAVTAGVPWLTFSCPVCGPVRLGRPAHAQPAPGRCDLKPDLVGVLPAVNMRALGVRGL